MRLNLRRGAVIGLAAFVMAMPARIAFAVETAPPPTMAVADSYSTDEDTVLSVDKPGLLQNDNAGDSTCVIGSDSQGTTGTVSVGPDGSFTYMPPANFHGQTTFVYRIVDVGPCADQVANSEATVTITVDPVNDPPTAAADSFLVLKDRTLNVGVPGVLLNDHDVDGDSLSAVMFTNSAHGVVTLAANGSFSYTPGSGYVGPDAFSYEAWDGHLFSPTRVVSLTVTAVPPVPTPTPTPTAIPTPVPTLEPTATPEVTAEPPPSAEPSETIEPTAAIEPTVAPSATPVASPAPTAVPQTAAGSGGISLPLLLVIVLLVLLVGFGAALYGPRWLAAQRGQPMDDDDIS